MQKTAARNNPITTLTTLILIFISLLAAPRDTDQHQERALLPVIDILERDEHLSLSYVFTALVGVKSSIDCSAIRLSLVICTINTLYYTSTFNGIIPATASKYYD
jgi:hypothetical protein